MANTGVNDKYLMTFKGTLCNQTILSTFWWDLFAKGGITNVEDAYTVLMAGITPVNLLKDKYLAVMPTNYTLEEVWVQKIYDARVMKKITAFAAAGTGGGAASTANTAAVIVRRGELANRKNVSTLHIPIPDVTAQAGNGIINDVAYLTDLGDLATEMLNPINGAGAFAPAVFKPVVFQPGPPPGPTTQYIVQTQVKTTVRVMRRRSVGLGI